MKKCKTIVFGKFPVTSKRRVNEISVDVEWSDETGHGLPRFSVCGHAWNATHTDITMGGQCLDELNEFVCKYGKSVKMVKLWKEVYGLWQRNHLNDMVAYANEDQRKAVDECVDLNGGKFDYDKVCDFLKSKGIYYVYVNGNKCGYGEKWYYKPIPEEDVKRIEGIFTENT